MTLLYVNIHGMIVTGTAGTTTSLLLVFYVVSAVEFLGFTKLLLPYANASGKGILRGLNYASGGAGIWDETGKQWVITIIRVVPR